MVTILFTSIQEESKMRNLKEGAIQYTDLPVNVPVSTMDCILHRYTATFNSWNNRILFIQGLSNLICLCNQPAGNYMSVSMCTFQNSVGVMIIFQYY